jgi:predicted lactoylglutathione lyase
MIKEFWLNLPVKDINKSKTFFSQLGFKFNTQNGNSDASACMLIGDKNVVVMLFEEPAFKGFTQHEVADTSKGSEILLSIDAQSKEEVDELTQKAIEAGGTSTHKPSEMKGWMYGSLFIDLDGHRWNVLYMDMNRMQQG